MSKFSLTRRQFMAATSAATLSASGSASAAPAVWGNRDKGKLAIFGGEPVRTRSFPEWPYWDDDVLNSIVSTVKSRKWCRIEAPETGTVVTFERKYAELLGAGHCVATGSGTQALHTCVEALGIGPGDEVITSPYTDPGTIASILAARALPVLADLDPASYQIDPQDVERRITPNTRAIMPVHMMGQPCDMDAIMDIARRHDLKVIEDACQAHLASHRGRKLGTIGDLGCFSFQSSKTLACGEGGAIVGNNSELMDRCYTVHNHGTSRRGRTELAGPKYRMNELEAALLLGQWPGLGDRYQLRNRNAGYLSRRLAEMEGLTPQKLYPGTESGSFYLYPTSYDKSRFGGADRARFLKAVAAEGVSLSPYIKQGLHREPWVDNILGQDLYQQEYGASRLKEYRDQLPCPNCDRVCEEMVMIWASGPLLGNESDMDDIVNAILKVHEHRDQLDRVEVDG